MEKNPHHPGRGHGRWSGPRVAFILPGIWGSCVYFAFVQRTDADVGGERAAIVDLIQREIGLFDNVSPILHGDRVRLVRQNNGVAWNCANPEYFGQGLVIEIAKAAANTNSVDDMVQRNTRAPQQIKSQPPHERELVDPLLHLVVDSPRKMLLGVSVA